MLCVTITSQQIDQLQPVCNVQLFINALDVGFDRINRYVKLIADVLIGQPLRQQFNHFEFPLGQCVLVLERLPVRRNVQIPAVMPEEIGAQVNENKNRE